MRVRSPGRDGHQSNSVSALGSAVCQRSLTVPALDLLRCCTLSACSDALIPVPGPELLEQVRKGCQRMTLETCPWAHRTSRNQEDEIA